MIREKFETHKRAIYLLSEGQDAIKNLLPAGSNSGVNFANSTAADKLKHLMEEVKLNYSLFIHFLNICIQKENYLGRSIKN